MALTISNSIFEDGDTGLNGIGVALFSTGPTSLANISFSRFFGSGTVALSNNFQHNWQEVTFINNLGTPDIVLTNNARLDWTNSAPLSLQGVQLSFGSELTINGFDLTINRLTGDSVCSFFIYFVISCDSRLH